VTDDAVQRRERERQLAACEEALGHHFTDRSLLELALTHSSARDPWTESNERLEFLGDAVIGLVVSENLFCENPDETEGELTRLRSLVVSRDALAKVDKANELKPYLRVGKGIRKSRRMPPSMISNAFEALVGALYMDAGYETARTLILEWLEDRIRRASVRRDVTNYKAALQQVAQRLFRQTPTYRLLEAHGPDHRKEFHVEAVVNGRGFPAGRGSTKKQAEQRAARAAMRVLKQEHGDDLSRLAGS
jgi:ribonuclease-3